MTKRWAGGMLLGMAMGMATTMSAEAAVSRASFGKLPDGRGAEVYTLTGAALEVKITTYGARVVSILAADREGKKEDVVLGYGSVDGYVAEADKKTYFGAIVGRYGNRIRGGKFAIDGKTFQVPTNNNGNALHGGPHGFDDQLWVGKEIPMGVEMTLVSKDGDMGFPGTLTVHVKYTLHGSTLRIDYAATTDKTTVVNVTNHSYFNLSGEGKGTILGEKIMIHARGYTPVDQGLIPVGGVQPVAGTPFDFTKATVIGERMGAANEQLKIAGGYDHNWVLEGKAGEMKEAALVTDPASGRTLRVDTTEPGVQFYTGNFLDGSYKGKSGAAYVKNGGLCLETQHFPDSPNQPGFPSTLLEPGQRMHSTTTFTFGVVKQAGTRD